MCSVDLQDFESRMSRVRCRGKRLHDGVDSRLIKRHWRRVTFAKRHRAGSYGKPAAPLHRDRSAVLFPRHVATRLAARMGDLNARRRAHALDERCDARQEFDVLIFVDIPRSPGVMRPRASTALASAITNAGAAYGPAAKVDRVLNRSRIRRRTSTGTWEKRKCGFAK